MSNLIFITKDVLRNDYLKVYNHNSYFNTPNISKLASVGTVFKRFYSSAPTTNLAVISMFTGKPIYKHGIKSIKNIVDYNFDQTLFSYLENNGVKTFTLWSKEFEKLTKGNTNVFHENTEVHYSPNYGVEIAPQKFAFSERNNKDNLSKNNLLEYFFEYIKNIEKNGSSPWFLWCHCPHVIPPGKSYGSDIDYFDEFVGRIMENINTQIIISADHGHQNCEKGRIAYGYDVYEPSIHIPLITPNYFNAPTIDFPVDQSQLFNIISKQQLEKKDFIYSDTRFYKQNDRKLSIIRNNHKYIFNKSDASEELYDLIFDKNENVNLLIDNYPDLERGVSYPLNEVYFYPYWQEAEKNYYLLKSEKERIWRAGNIFDSIIEKFKTIRRNLKKKGLSWLISKKRKTTKLKGRWNSKARIPL
jgi:hypothetical protein